MIWPDQRTALVFLEIVGHHLWQGLGLVLAAGLVLRLARHCSASTRYAVWSTALVAVAALPLSAWLPRPVTERPRAAAPIAEGRAPVEVAPPATETTGTPALASSIGSPQPRVPTPLPIRGLATGVLAVWALGSLWMLANLVRRARRAGRIRDRARACDGPEAAWLAGEARRAGAGRVELLESDEVATPQVLGISRPAIVVPTGLRSRLRPAALRPILLHELAHIARHDPWHGLIQRAIVAVWFFHPGVRLVDRELSAEREAACDDWAIGRTGDARGYASALLRVCEAIHRTRARPAALALDALTTRHELTRRIDVMLDTPRDRRTDVSRPVLAACGIVAVFALTASSLVMPQVRASASRSAGSAETMDRALTRAALDGDLREVRRWLDAGADPNASLSREPRSPLNAAARGGHGDVVRLLLESGAEVDRVVRGDATPLIAACRQGHNEVALLLLAGGADVNYRLRGDGTPLIAAARSGNAHLVRNLLAAGADPNLTVRGDGSALTAASDRGHEEIVRLLIDHGADADLAVRGDGSPLINAAAHGETAMIRALLDGGADIDRAVPGDGTPLIVAARNGRADLVRELLDRGANPDRGSGGDGNPLIMAARHGHREIVEMLLDAGADIDRGVGGDGNPLIAAAAAGRYDVVRVLIDRGARLDAVVPGDETALIQAAGHGELEVARLLVDRGADVNKGVRVRDYRSGGQVLRTPLSMAKRGGHDEVVAFLESRGAVD